MSQEGDRISFVSYLQTIGIILVVVGLVLNLADIGNLYLFSLSEALSLIGGFIPFCQ